MRAMFILRPEIVCLSVLIFVQIYAYIYKNTTAKVFRMACWFGIIHLVFDAVTVMTVNNILIVPGIINDICHYGLYISAACFCCVYLDYIAAQVLSAPVRRKLLWFCKGLIGLYIIASPFMTVCYVENPVTNYSLGTAVYIIFGTAFVYFIIGIALMIARRKRMERRRFVFSISTTVFMMACVVLQLMIPTFLFTGCAMTLVILGMLFAIENPAGYYQNQAFVDISTGIKNKNCYKEDLNSLVKKYSKIKNTEMSIVMCDLNNLKYTNDTYGHLAGDELIRNAARILVKYFKGEYGVYRFGGDEFVVLFINKDKNLIEHEICIIKDTCKTVSKSLPAPLSISLGYSSTTDISIESLSSTLMDADGKMYEEKQRTKAESGLNNVWH